MLLARLVGGKASELGGSYFLLRRPSSPPARATRGSEDKGELLGGSGSLRCRMYLVRICYPHSDHRKR